MRIEQLCRYVLRPPLAQDTLVLTAAGQVVLRLRPFRGGALAAGRCYELVAMERFEVRDCLIRSRWSARDSAAQARRLGLPLA